MKKPILVCLSAVLGFASCKGATLAADLGQRALRGTGLLARHRDKVSSLKSKGVGTMPPISRDGFKERQLNLLAKSAELAKLHYEQELPRSSMSPNDALLQSSSISKLKHEMELAQWHLRNASFEVVPTEFDERRIRQLTQLAAMARAEYDDAIAMNNRVPNSVARPEIDRLKLIWEIAVIRADLARGHCVLNLPPRK